VGARLLTERTELLTAVARRIGTPVFVYDADHIRNQYGALNAALQGVPHRVHYSVKANSSVAILGVLRKLGAGVDVVSVGEMARAFRAGFRPGDIIFSGVGKRPDELEQAVAQRIRMVNVESVAEFELLCRIAERQGGEVRVGVRVNPDVETATHPYTQTGKAGMKFGVPLDEVATIAVRTLDIPSLSLVAIGMHIGSQIFDAAQFGEGASRLRELVVQLRDLGVTSLDGVDVGGGIGIRYVDEPPMKLAEYAAALRPLVEDTGLPIVLEPGRYLVGNAGALLTRTLYRKHSGGKTFVIVDAGMNDLLRPSLYGAMHEIAVVGGAADTGSDAIDGELVDVVGPVCETGDFIAKDRYLPGAVPGALLAVRSAGAYGFTMGSTYNSRPRPPEVLVDGDRWAVIRERESLEDLMRGEYTLDQVDAAGGWTETSGAGVSIA
jgi:diaminopimelate decarboxylase